MGRTRTEPRQRPRQEEPSSLEEEVAAAIAALLAGAVPLPTGVSLVAAISALLGALPDAPDGPTRDAAARLVAGDRTTASDGTGALRRAYVDNLIHSAYYAINASRRLGAAVAGGEDLGTALRREGRYLVQHREANRRREAGARMVEAAVELHGPVLGWKHGHPNEPRPTHEAADGKNFDPYSVPASTGALPGVLPGCTCVPTAPFSGAETLR
jgi:hypothetical protein